MTNTTRPWALPGAVAHADWGSNPSKRQVAVARRDAAGWYEVLSARQVGDDADPLLALGLSTRDLDGGVVLGFDFPIGLPLAYARATGITDWVAAVPAFGHGAWVRFYSVAESAAQLGLYRPFYPAGPGKKGEHAKAQLADQLGISLAEMRRVCEQPDHAPSAEVLFWTLGPRQVGRAALDGWQRVLLPLLREHPAVVRLWPFDGGLEDLLQGSALVIAETYPRIFYGHFDFDRQGWRKRDQSGRRCQGEGLLTYLAENHPRSIRLDPTVRRQVADGFGPAGSGEDAFDAVVGLLGILDVLLGGHPPGGPLSDEVGRIEGWILGCP